jgi:DNA-damage-inducible protein D
METEIIHTLTNNFESFSHKTEDGVEFWLARDLQQLLGYTKWDNFKNVIFKAKTACELSGQEIENHFADVGKMVQIGSGATKEIDDIMLTRYACYLIAQNGDSGKKEIAFAQTYFAVQTRKAELIEQKMLEYERVQAREKLKNTEKELSKVIYEQTGGNQNFGIIRSKGDQALFGRTTQQMKNRWGISGNKPLADHMPTILLKAKDFATEITIFNAKENQMRSEKEISTEHITNNKAVRETLISRGITPENLSPEEDVKKVERKLHSEEKKIVKQGSFDNKKESISKSNQ